MKATRRWEYELNTNWKKGSKFEEKLFVSRNEIYVILGRLWTRGTCDAYQSLDSTWNWIELNNFPFSLFFHPPRAVSIETTVFGAGLGMCVLVVVFFLYMNRKWCFSTSGNFPCCDEKLATKTIHSFSEYSLLNPYACGMNWRGYSLTLDGIRWVEFFPTAAFRTSWATWEAAIKPWKFQLNIHRI